MLRNLNTQEAATSTLRWLARRSAAVARTVVAAVISATVTAASQTEKVLVNTLLSLSGYSYTVQTGVCTGVRLLVPAVGSCATAAVMGVLLLCQWAWWCYKVCIATLRCTVFIPCQSEHMLLPNTRMACDDDTGVYAEQCDSVALFSVLQAGANTPPMTVTPTPMCGLTLHALTGRWLLVGTHCREC
jgi:hypothetical protein